MPMAIFQGRSSGMEKKIKVFRLAVRKGVIVLGIINVEFFIDYCHNERLSKKKSFGPEIF